jgi:hypothetical protein
MYLYTFSLPSVPVYAYIHICTCDTTHKQLWPGRISPAWDKRDLMYFRKSTSCELFQPSLTENSLELIPVPCPPLLTWFCAHLYPFKFSL